MAMNRYIPEVIIRIKRAFPVAGGVSRARLGREGLNGFGFARYCRGCPSPR